MLERAKVSGRPPVAGRTRKLLGFFLSIRNQNRSLSVSPSPSSLGTGADCLGRTGHPIFRPGQGARPQELWREWRSVKRRDGTVALRGGPPRPDARAGGRSWTWGAGQVVDSGSCAACPQGHPGRGSWGLEQQEEGSAGQPAYTLFGEARRHELPTGSGPRERDWAQASLTVQWEEMG